MTGVLLALVVALVVGLAAVPWRAGVRTRFSAVAGPSVAVVRSRLGAAAGSGDDEDDVPAVDVVLVLDLLQVAVASGAAVPRALQAVGDAVGGADGDMLAQVARSLVLGAGWATAWSGVDPRFDPLAACLADSWGSGSAPGPALRAAAEQVGRERRRAAREAAGRLGVRLVLPLGLCFLPAFVLLGLVPVLVSLAGGLLG